MADWDVRLTTGQTWNPFFRCKDSAGAYVDVSGATAEFRIDGEVVWSTANNKFSILAPTIEAFPTDLQLTLSAADVLNAPTEKKDFAVLITFPSGGGTDPIIEDGKIIRK